ncbi:hypothetical protein INR77_09085 [Erythrobacter sp. SCSIO 43205]|uniref:hypothetical protein n=1 Tax=Erythrobacter sp. SCSIO 43205 TaxID=2779361 RepID=UPI001CAA2064|nr:hypothetical protein [Erythrobacter sp. SCSIO 43205]UAB77000.1 hypothetical protein INR77_09085 [Erythrobacter sp. SCSIO 43205]
MSDLQPPALIPSEKKAQVQSAISKVHGFPLCVIQSDTHPKLMGIWCDNGLAGIGQVAIVTREFHEGQAEGICTLANAAMFIPAMVDRIEELERALEDIAKQCLVEEVEDRDGDYEFAYECCVKRARQALEKKP